MQDITKFKDELFNNLLRGTVNEEKIDLIPFFNGFSDSLTKRYRKAVVQISLPNYYIEPDELVNLIEVFWKRKRSFY